MPFAPRIKVHWRVSVFAAPTNPNQMLLGIGTCIAHTMLLCYYTPYEAGALDLVAIAASLQICFTLVTGLAVTAQTLNENQQVSRGLRPTARSLLCGLM